MIARRLLVLVASLALGAGLVVAAPASASAATTSQVRQAQAIMFKFGIPAGPVDGDLGPRTRRGLCTFRIILGATPTRNTLTTNILGKLREYHARYDSLSEIPAPNVDGHDTYLLAHEACQSMVYVEDGRYRKAMSISTGAAGHGTPNGRYTLGDNVHRGWTCSTAYPESCSEHSEGRFAGRSGYGNMYNKRYFRAGGYFIHGSGSVPTHPASHGCIRTSVALADWMDAHVGQVHVRVTGSY